MHPRPTRTEAESEAACSSEMGATQAGEVGEAGAVAVGCTGVRPTQPAGSGGGGVGRAFGEVTSDGRGFSGVGSDGRAFREVASEKLGASGSAASLLHPQVSSSTTLLSDPIHLPHHKLVKLL